MMKKAGYALGYAAALWMLFALWVRVMTLGDIAPAAQPYYDALAPLLARPAVWLILSAALICGAIVRLFRGQCGRAESPPPSCSRCCVSSARSAGRSSRR